jgi:hypothetical protein
LDGNCTGADENDEKNGNDKSTCNSEITCNKNKKQRKSNSSDMIDLMKDFITQQQVDKEKQRQERQNIHNDKKAMHKEKILSIFNCFSTIVIQFFTLFLDWEYAGR